MEANLYEAMFLVDSAKGGSQFPAVVRHISGLLERHEGEIERIERWAERKLAYPIKQVEKGIYVLVYFRLSPERVAELRRALTLSEEILRVLILRADGVGEPQGELWDAEGRHLEPEPAAPSDEVEAAPAEMDEDAQAEQGGQEEVAAQEG